MIRQLLSETMFTSARRTRRGCWIWRHSNNGKGYSRVWLKGRNVYAHRHSFIVHKGPIPKGKDVCHECDNPACINPEHLFLGNAKVNGMDCSNKGRTTHGERNSSAKLRVSDVRDLRRKARTGNLSRTAEARRLGVTRMTIKRAVFGITWKRV